jgi:hypothetical protein
MNVLSLWVLSYTAAYSLVHFRIEDHQLHIHMLVRASGRQHSTENQFDEVANIMFYYCNSDKNSILVSGPHDLKIAFR